MAQLKRAVTIMIKKRNEENNLVSMVCDLYDMSAYVDLLRCLVIDGVGDYIVIEPLRQTDLFGNEVY